MDDNNEYMDAFVAEFSDAPPVETTPAAPPADETQVSGAPEAPATPPAPAADETGAEGAEPAAPAPEVHTPPKEGDKQEAPAAEQPPVPQYATKEDIRRALQEDREAITQRTESIVDMKEAVIKHLHPDGVDRKLYDSKNREINTHQDIVDRGLINPDTNEPFTEEEAARWMMTAQQAMNEQYSELEKYAETAAETYVTLKEGNDRVMDLYGDILQVMPGVAKQLSEMYHATLVQDENGIITRVPLDPVDFYQRSLAPYIKLAKAELARDEAEAKEAAQQRQLDQEERIGLPARGHSKSKANTGDPFLDALMDEMENE